MSEAYGLVATAPLAVLLDATTTGIALVLLIAWVFWHGTWIQKLGTQVETLNARLAELERKNAGPDRTNTDDD